MTGVMSACAKSIAPETCRERLAVPCRDGDPDLWFAESPVDLERAKALCEDCPLRLECLNAALEREEPWGVWGGEIIDRGVIVSRKRPRGRPRKNPQQNPAAA
jgi:WhiB family redox-sensing transcriptional regulator